MPTRSDLPVIECVTDGGRNVQSIPQICSFISLTVQRPLLSLGVNLVVQLKEAFQDFAAGFGVDGEANAVIFGEVIDLVEVVIDVEVGPAVGFEDGVVHLDVEVTEFVAIPDNW